MSATSETVDVDAILARLIPKIAAAVRAELAAALAAQQNAAAVVVDRVARAAELRKCSDCDDQGWLLDADGIPTDPARKCTHRREPVTLAEAPVARDFSAPAHPIDADQENARP